MKRRSTVASISQGMRALLLLLALLLAFAGCNTTEPPMETSPSEENSTEEESSQEIIERDDAMYKVVEFNFKDLKKIPDDIRHITVSSKLQSVKHTYFASNAGLETFFDNYFEKSPYDYFEEDVCDDNVILVVVRYGYDSENYVYYNAHNDANEKWDLFLEERALNPYLDTTYDYWIDFVVIPMSDYNPCLD